MASVDRLIALTEAKELSPSTQKGLSKHATTVATSGGRTRVTYHETVIVDFSPDDVILNSGGWRTTTTKLKMNQASAQFELGYVVYQEGGRDNWFVEVNGEKVKFEDGMKVSRKRQTPPESLPPKKTGD